MLNRYITFYKPGIQFVVFLAILSMSFLTGGFFIDKISQAMTGMSSLEFSQLTEMSKELADKMKIINSILLAMVLLLPAFIFAYLAFPSPTKYLGLNSKLNLQFWILGFILFAVAFPFTSLLEEWNSGFSFLAKFKAEDDRISAIYMAMLKGSKINDLILNTFMICLAPAIIEEVFFRGCLQQLFANWLRKNQWVGIIVVAIIFSAFHGQMSGFLPRLFLGLLLGIVYHFTNNLWITILLHFLNNFTTILMMYLYNSGSIKTNPMDLPSVNIFVGIASGIATVGVGYYFYTKRREFEISEVEKDPLEIEQLFKND